jgi:hypothetical protein
MKKNPRDTDNNKQNTNTKLTKMGWIGDALGSALGSGIGSIFGKRNEGGNIGGTIGSWLPFAKGTFKVPRGNIMVNGVPHLVSVRAALRGKKAPRKPVRKVVRRLKK